MQNTVYDMDRFGFGGGPDPDNIDDPAGGSPSSQRPAALGDAKPLPKSVRVARQNESGKLKGGYSAPTVQRRQGLQTEAIPAALQPMPTVSFPSSVVLGSAPAPAVQTAAH